MAMQNNLLTAAFSYARNFVGALALIFVGVCLISYETLGMLALKFAGVFLGVALILFFAKGRVGAILSLLAIALGIALPFVLNAIGNAMYAR